MTDEERNRAVLEGQNPHQRPDETPSDPDKTAVIRGETRIEDVRRTSETTTETPTQSDGDASATSDDASSEDSGADSSDGGDA